MNKNLSKKTKSKVKKANPRNWTPEQDEILLAAVATHTTVAEAIKTAATQLGKTPHAVSQHYLKLQAKKGQKPVRKTSKPRKIKSVKEEPSLDVQVPQGYNPKNITLEDCIMFLTSLKSKIDQVKQIDL
jgi:hypothetical protein